MQKLQVQMQKIQNFKFLLELSESTRKNIFKYNFRLFEIEYKSNSWASINQFISPKTK